MCLSYPASLRALAVLSLLFCLRVTLVRCCWLTGCLAVRDALSRGAETRSSREAPAGRAGAAADVCLPSRCDDAPLGRRTGFPEWLEPGEFSPDRPAE